MKVANDSQAPLGMILLSAAFILVMSLVLFWPRSPGNQSTGYAEDGTAVQSDTVPNPKTSSNEAQSTRQYQ